MTSTAAGSLRLVAGLVIGFLLGLLLEGQAEAIMADVLRPVGSLWLDALTMTVVPLVFGLLVNGIASASRGAEAGRTSTQALILFAVMLALACLTAAALAELLLNLWPVRQLSADALGPLPPPPTSGADEWYGAIIPANPIRSAADMAMVPLVVFALFLGFALARIDADAADAVLKPLRALVSAMLVIVRWVLLAGPLGIAALAFGAGSNLGAGAIGLLGQYVVVVAACCLCVTLLAYVWAMMAGRAGLLRFARAVLPAQAVALGTQSSLATLPLMVQASARLGVPSATAGIVLPLAVSIFRASSAAANVAVTLYLARLHGLDLGVEGAALAALVAVPVSLGAVGLPAQVSFFATIAPVCIAVGVPVTMLPLLLAIEAVPDLFRTLGNVTYDIAAATLIGGRRSDQAN